MRSNAKYPNKTKQTYIKVTKNDTNHPKSKQNQAKSITNSTPNNAKSSKITQNHTFTQIFTKSQQNCVRLHKIINNHSILN